MPQTECSPLDCLDRAADLAREFRQTVDEGPQRALYGYQQMVERFAAPLPQDGAPALETVDRLSQLAVPGLQRSAGSRFFGWVIGGSHPVGVAADWLTAAWGQNAGNPACSPAAAACETVAARWLIELLDLPPESSVGFVTGATMANFVGLAAARGALLERAGWDLNAHGLFGAPPIQVLIGEEAHATVHAALQYLGFGQAQISRIAVDSQGAILPAAFDQALRRAAGPALVILQAGQINTGTFDNFEQLVPLARARGAWIHVDGAFGLWARSSPLHRRLAAGLEHADSWAVDGHKWLQVPYDSGYVIVRDSRAHERAMTISASYLPMASGERDPSHFVPELSRRARGFATWAMISHLGRKGIEAMVERHVRLAQLLAQTLAREPGITVMNEVVLNQVIVRFGADSPADQADSLTRATISRVQDNAECYVGGASWRGQWVMRISVIGFATDEKEISRTAQAIASAWSQIRASTGNG